MNLTKNVYLKKKISDNSSFITNITQLSTSISDKVKCLSESNEESPAPTTNLAFALQESFKGTTNEYSNTFQFIRLNTFVSKGMSGEKGDLANETLV